LAHKKYIARDHHLNKFGVFCSIRLKDEAYIYCYKGTFSWLRTSGERKSSKQSQAQRSILMGREK
jgi:hypothetical protein